MRAAPRSGLRAGANTAHHVRFGRTEVAAPALKHGQIRCPVCRKGVTPTPTRRLRAHNDLLGERCYNRLSGFAFVPLPPLTPREAAPAKPPTIGHGYNVGSQECPDCGRYTPVLADGSFRKHRPVADTFAGPYCAGWPS